MASHSVSVKMERQQNEEPTGISVKTEEGQNKNTTTMSVTKEEEQNENGSGASAKDEQNEIRTRKHPASTSETQHEDSPQAKRPKLAQEDSVRVQLNRADCNLDFDIDFNGLEGQALHENGFAYCWSGARATVGIRGGKYCFACKVVANQSVDMEDTPPDQQHVCRVGISRGDENVGNLGETEHSLGFGGTGKFSTAGKFVDYGSKYSVGDTILCCVNLEVKPLAEISFMKNGNNLGIAKKFDSGPKGFGIIDTPIKDRAWESALFPHVLLKNVVVRLQFSPEDGLIPPEGFKPWSAAFQDGNAILGPQFAKKNECEVLMMVGLPAAGKTTWAEKWAKEHPEKRYMVLGTNLALDQMKVPGLLRKHNYGERFDKLMNRATGIFNTLLGRAAKTLRNYILDQTNVYKSARKRKLRPFVDFKKIAVCIFPPPEELKERAKKRYKEMGKEVPPEAVNEMLANYILPRSKDMPSSDEFFDEVWFPELKMPEAQRILESDKSELKAKSITKSQDNSRENSVCSVSGPRAFQKGESPAVKPSWQGAEAGRSGYNAYNSRDISSYHHVTPGVISSSNETTNPYNRAGSVGSTGSRISDQREFSVEAGGWRASDLSSGQYPHMGVDPYQRNESLGPTPYQRIESRNPSSYAAPNNPYQRIDSRNPSSYGAPNSDLYSTRGPAPYDNALNRYGRDSYTDPRIAEFREARGPYPISTGSPNTFPPSYGMAEPGRSHPPQPTHPGSYPMGPRRPGWGYPRY
eukprot:TRINITY_DN3541_c0_g1_i1.p1 TRINITY_DN3541_c0_g1~~TRINITY_DN3541_c0_g1_i1.p1  ORF type:complete len:750 (-),score=172.85 TRINITY_DN3541_c0_g1_i1:269-2518(-)